jgi:hypothetical protein
MSMQSWRASYPYSSYGNMTTSCPPKTGFLYTLGFLKFGDSTSAVAVYATPTSYDCTADVVNTIFEGDMQLAAQ